MSMIWNNYYDEVMYEEATLEHDYAGNVILKKPVKINVRDVSGGENYVVDTKENGGTSITYTKEYQVPFMVMPDSKIDGRIVISVEPAKDVFGNFHYCIVRVL